MFLDFINDLANYDDRKIARAEAEDNNGIGVSTCWTSDEGWETALLDANDVVPVENYKTREEALVGHDKWVEFAKTGDGKTVTKLGWSDFGPEMNQEVTLQALIIPKQLRESK